MSRHEPDPPATPSLSRWEFEAFPGTPPLDILVRVAYSMANWLKGFPLRNAPPADKGRPRDRVVALHVNAGLGSPHHTAYFLAACALYLAEGTAGHPRFRSVEEAYCELVNHAPMPDSKDPGGGMAPNSVNSHPSTRARVPGCLVG